MELWFSEEMTENSRFSLKVKKQLFHEKSDFQTISVFDTYDFGRIMTIDGKFMVTERDEFIYHDMIAHIPLLAHPSPRKVCIIGGGDGGTMREVLRHDCIESVELCEIDSLVIEAAKQFFPKLSSSFDHPKAKTHIADGIAFLEKAQANSYDIILVDSTDPAGPAEGLFNKEFYQSVHRALKADGIMVVQSEGPLWIPEMVKEIVDTVRSLFPIAEPYTFPVPTYPMGYWSFTFASKKWGPFEKFQEDRARALKTRYYNEDIHRAAFSLPNFMKHTLA